MNYFDFSGAILVVCLSSLMDIVRLHSGSDVL
jgi:hypothetical protein